MKKKKDVYHYRIVAYDIKGKRHHLKAFSEVEKVLDAKDAIERTSNYHRAFVQRRKVSKWEPWEPK